MSITPPEMRENTEDLSFISKSVHKMYIYKCLSIRVGQFLILFPTTQTKNRQNIQTMHFVKAC